MNPRQKMFWLTRQLLIGWMNQHPDLFGLRNLWLISVLWIEAHHSSDLGIKSEFHQCNTFPRKVDIARCSKSPPSEHRMLREEADVSLFYVWWSIPLIIKMKAINKHFFLKMLSKEWDVIKARVRCEMRWEKTLMLFSKVNQWLVKWPSIKYWFAQCVCLFLIYFSNRGKTNECNNLSTSTSWKTFCNCFTNIPNLFLRPV